MVKGGGEHERAETFATHVLAGGHGPKAPECRLAPEPRRDPDLVGVEGRRLAKDGRNSDDVAVSLVDGGKGCRTGIVVSWEANLVDRLVAPEDRLAQRIARGGGDPFDVHLHVARVSIGGAARRCVMSLHRDAAGFSKAADAYDRGRPGYPGSIVDWIVDTGALSEGRVVVDLAAGTGKLTRELAVSGAEVVAVEPIAEMRAALATSVPGVRRIAGTAEATSLPSGSADVVTVAQAFHWFASDAALAEIARVLKPGGVLVIVWNRRDLSQPLQIAISRIIDPYRSDTPSHVSGRWREVMDATDRFVTGGETHVDSEQVVDRPTLVDRVGSISFIANLPDPERVEVLAEIADLVAEGQVETLRYFTDAYAYRSVS